MMRKRVSDDDDDDEVVSVWGFGETRGAERNPGVKGKLISLQTWRRKFHAVEVTPAEAKKRSFFSFFSYPMTNQIILS